MEQITSDYKTYGLPARRSDITIDNALGQQLKLMLGKYFIYDRIHPYYNDNLYCVITDVIHNDKETRIYGSGFCYNRNGLQIYKDGSGVYFSVTDIKNLKPIDEDEFYAALNDRLDKIKHIKF